ncbi:MAG: FAD-binding oxidoreductase [Candidatus Hodarchaeales archaeon]|jgi:alkyldihydroxyacetonephosphate synthase
MEPFISIARWGERTPDHVKFTTNLKAFLLEQLQMDPKTVEKNYPQKYSWSDFDTKPKLVDGFISELTSLFSPTQISSDSTTRLRNSFGKSYLELIRLRFADIPSIVELVVYPSSHDEVVIIIQLCNRFNVPISTVGGGTSMTLGVQAPKGSIAVNLKKMNRIVSINTDSLYVTSQTGIFGPELEKILNHNNVTLGHFPQSWEFSTLGGWVATRGAGQNSTLYGKIEDMLMGFKVVTGSGSTLNIKKAPARATGPDWNQLFAGSEGAFGIITEVTLRVWKKPQTRKMSGFFFRTFEEGLTSIKQLLQNGFNPAIIRLYDPEETYHSEKASTLMKDPPRDSFIMRTVYKYLKTRGYIEKKRCLAIMVFEGDSDLVNLTRKKAVTYAKKHGGFHLWSIPAKSWIKSRYESPYLRDPILDHGILLETFETSMTWENIIPLYYSVRKRLKDECPVLWSHASHFYKNGANLYFHVFAPQEEANEINQFLRIKKKIIETFLEYGSTVSHHHGIGRAFSPWLSQAIDNEGIKLLNSIKTTLDPRGIMNPGVFSESDPS